MKKIFIICILFVLSYAEVPAPNTAPPAPDYVNMVPEKAEQSDTKSFIGNDDLNQDKIQFGLGYEKDTGVSNIKKITLDNGNTQIIDTRTNNPIDLSEKKNSTEYKNAYEKGMISSTSSTELTAEKKASLKEAKNKRKEELNKSEYSPKKTEDFFHQGNEPAARGNSIVNQLFFTSTTNDSENVQKASEFYKNNYSTSQDKNNIKTLNSSNVDILKNAYSTVDELKAKIDSKKVANNIQCFISRELVPKYYCPLLDKTETTYGGDMKTTTAMAVKECGQNCKDIHSCLPYKVVDDLNVNLGTTGVLNLHPNWSTTTNSIKTGIINNVMQIENISFDVIVTPSSEWTGTTEDFEKFLETTKIKFRYSLIKQNDSLGNPPELIVDKELVTINSSLMKKTTLILTNAESFSFIGYKPFIAENTTVATLTDQEKLKYVEKIELKNIKAKYKSKEVFFCPFRQLVNLASECNGEGGTMITLTNGAQIYNICTDSSHKIGPDTNTGGFYSDEDCKASCIEKADCLPTYKHYGSYTENQIFKAKIGCVDSPDNNSCSEAKCQDLLSKVDIRPINEWVTYNDHDRKQTITNSVINPNIMRPKINLGEEMASSPNYDEMFQSEMKDSAYKYMLNKGTFNRITYRLGEESPKKMSYTKEFYNGQAEMLKLNLKPKSKDIDNNKEYYLYIVLEVDELYKPVAGVFQIEGQSVSATQLDWLQFRDKSYMIKTNAETDNWKIFRKIQFTNRKKLYDIKRCTDGTANGTYEEQPFGYYSNQELPSNCTVSMKIVWPETPQMNIDSYGYFLTGSGVFADLSENTEKAFHFVKQKFSSNVVINTYTISENTIKDIYNTPGVIIKDQHPILNDASFQKDYNVPITEDKKAGWIYDYKVYAIYSETELTYKSLIDKVTEENAFYSKSNPNVYPTKINHDGEINNNIKPFLLGDSNITTVNLETTPFTQEEGQKVFKFMFLYDDANGTKPFAGYQIKGN